MREFLSVILRCKLTTDVQLFILLVKQHKALVNHFKNKFMSFKIKYSFTSKGELCAERAVKPQISLK